MSKDTARGGGNPTRSRRRSESDTPGAVSGSPTLQRGAIGLSDAVVNTLSNMAPVEGIFIVVVLVAASMGSLTPWAFMLGAVAIFMTGWNLAQFARRVPSAGSYVGFAFHGGNAVRPGLGRHAAAFIFYLSLLSAPVTIAAVVVFLGS